MTSETPFVVVDLETTGLIPSLDRIIEFGAVKVVGGKIVEEWHSLVNPGIFVPAEVTHFTGITTEMLEDSPSFEDLIDPFLNFMGTEAIFVAHNVDFDRDFINSHLKKWEKAPMSHPYLCTVDLAKKVHPNLSKYNLGFLAETFGVELPQAHRALHDAKATAELLLKFLKVLENGGLRDMKDIPGLKNLPRVEVVSSGQGQSSLF